MKKIFYLFILLFIVGCSNSGEIIIDDNNLIQEKVIDSNNIEFDENTTEEDIDELIDIIFEDLLRE